MLNLAAVSNYRNVAVSTASREGLILLAYEGAIKFVKQAKIYIESGEVAAKCDRLSKASAIIEELSNSLNMEQGGEIAERLSALYDYMMRQLCQANLKSDPEMLDEVLSILNTLYEGWYEIVEKPGMVSAEDEVSSSSLYVSAI